MPQARSSSGYIMYTEHESGHIDVLDAHASAQAPLLKQVNDTHPSCQSDPETTRSVNGTGLITSLRSMWALEWLREWRVMNALTNKCYAAIILAIMIFAILMTGLKTWSACDKFITNDEPTTAKNSAMVDCASSVGELMLAACPVFMLWSLQTVMVTPGPLATLCELCPSVDEKSKVWFARWRAGTVGMVSLFAGGYLFFDFVRQLVAIASGEFTDGLRLWADSASPAPWP